MTGSARREGAYRVGDRAGAGAGNIDVDGVGGENRGVNGNGDRTGVGTRMEEEIWRGTQDKNGGGSGTVTKAVAEKGTATKL